MLVLPFLPREMTWEFNINCSELSFGHGSSSRLGRRALREQLRSCSHESHS